MVDENDIGGGKVTRNPFFLPLLQSIRITVVPRGGLDKTCLWFVVYTWEMMNGRKWRKKRLEECLAGGRGQEEDFSDPRYIHMDVDFCGDQFNRNPRIESTSIRFEA